MGKCAVAPEGLTDTHPRQGKKLAHETEVSDRNWMHHQHDLSVRTTGHVQRKIMSAMGQRRTLCEPFALFWLERKRALRLNAPPQSDHRLFDQKIADVS